MITRSYIYRVVPNDGAGKNPVAGGSAPDLGAGLRIERIDMVIEAAGIDDPINDRRAGLNTAIGGRSPKPVAVGCVEGINSVVIAADINDAVGDRW